MASCRLGELAALVGGQLAGDPQLVVSGLQSLEGAGSGDLSFVTGRRYLRAARASRAAAFLVGPEVELPDRPHIRVEQPYLAVAAVVRLFHPERRPAAGVDPSAWVAPTARISPRASVLPFAVVGEESVVEAGAVVHSHAVVGDRCRVGEDSVLHPHVVLREDVVVGQRVTIHAGSILGADGFGYVFDGAGHRKVPQVGRVVIEDDVEIGANVTIDRATLGDTVVGRGTKIDNLVQIGHNVAVGAHSIIVAQAGIAGSCRIGHHVILGGQVGLADHVTVGDGARVGSQAGVATDVPAGASVVGSPALPAREALRTMASWPRLPELIQTVRRLERRLATLEERAGVEGTEG